VGAPLPGPETVRYLGGIYDEPIRLIGKALLNELRAPGAAGHVRVDTLALKLTERVVNNYSSDARPYGTNDAGRRLDERRLRRVLDYIAAHIDEDVSLHDLADAACFSAFHFSRVFAATIGMPPHRYLSQLRLERAKTLLSLGQTPICDIALTCCFSSQSNFTRAFRRATGSTPMAYRRLRN
jgi:AraC family transcriptional regulator